MKKGFTLIEILVILTLIGILAAILVPQYRYSVVRAREAVLKENLYLLRDAINKFRYDKKRYPQSLEELVTEKYVARIPEDPIYRKAEWDVVYYEPSPDESYDYQEQSGIVDVKSRSSGLALDGTNYSEW
jgi:general secretion pathway protein G